MFGHFQPTVNQAIETLYCIFAYKGNEMQWSSFVKNTTANDRRHISVKTVEYRSCTNFVSSSAPGAILQKTTRHFFFLPETRVFFFLNG